MKGLYLNRRIKGLYAITPEEPDTNELLRKVKLALIGGARILQYRNKTAGEDLRFEQATALRQLTIEYSVPLIVNDDTILAHRAGADGVHLGSDDGAVKDAKALLGDGKLVGVSCYNRLELAIDAVRAGADYVAFGSFFASSVKPDAVAAPVELLRQARREISVPIVAIGGITVSNGAQLLEAGANALAVISAVFGAADIQDSAERFAALNFPDFNLEQKDKT